MGRKKKDSDESVATLSPMDQLDKEISDEYGEGIFISANSIKERHKSLISLSPVVNRLLGGGITSGSWMTLTGKPKIGKTVLSLYGAAKAQRPENGYIDKINGNLIPRNVYLIDAEGRIKERDFDGIPGLITTPDRFRVISSSEDTILSAEKFLNIVDKIIHTDRGAYIIIDSISCLAEEKRLTEIGAQTRGGQAKIVSDFCSRNATVVPIRDHIIICITHVIANTSGYGAHQVEKTPNSLLYQVDFKLRAIKEEEWKDSEGDEPYGKIVTWKCECSGLRGPGAQGQVYLRFGKGIDEVQEMINFAVDFGIVTKKAAWYSGEFEGFEPFKVCGMPALYELLSTNQELYNKIAAEASENFS
jgi:recombination protein RecA